MDDSSDTLQRFAEGLFREAHDVPRVALDAMRSPRSAFVRSIADNGPARNPSRFRESAVRIMDVFEDFADVDEVERLVGKRKALGPSDLRVVETSGRDCDEFGVDVYSRHVARLWAEAPEVTAVTTDVEDDILKTNAARRILNATALKIRTQVRFQVRVRFVTVNADVFAFVTRHGSISTLGPATTCR